MRNTRFSIGLTVIVLSAGGLLSAPRAEASLVGDTVTCSVSFFAPGIACNTPSAVVGAGTEFSIDAPAPGALIDISASSVQLTGSTSTNWINGDEFVLGDLDFIGDPTAELAAVSLSGVSGITGAFDPTDISFTADSIRVHLGDTTWTSASQATLGLTFRSTAVPEPGSLALLGIALGAFGLSRRRKKA